ncbi:MAG TPA: hypothetical protein VIM53_03020 [Candidatus Saccharimonadales bacterium]
MKTVVVLYGFCEGKRVGRKFHDCLRLAGFEVIEDASKADVIVAHSGGCFLVPEKTKAKLALLIGVPVGPAKSLPQHWLRKIAMDVSLHWREHAMRAWLAKTFWNGMYFWKISTDLKMLRALKSNDIFIPSDSQTVLIHNKGDGSSLKDAHTLSPRAISYELPGQHDDLWDNPKPYITLIEENLLQ